MAWTDGSFLLVFVLPSQKPTTTYSPPCVLCLAGLRIEMPQPAGRGYTSGAVPAREAPLTVLLDGQHASRRSCPGYQLWRQGSVDPVIVVITMLNDGQ